ncbi:FAD-dependent urate hydroxylase [Sorochytrium milnesiophthora]
MLVKHIAVAAVALAGAVLARPALRTPVYTDGWMETSSEVTAAYFDSPLLHQVALQRRQERPDCPPCFNCLLPAFECRNFAACNNYTGKCNCPPGFGGDDCSKPVCGALPDGQNRPIRNGPSCGCTDGWTGLNCNVCTRDDVCNRLVPTGMNGTCYRHSMAVQENFQMCNVTNPKIVQILGKDIPQVTFSCNRTDAACKFQFWAGGMESFFCGLRNCRFQQADQYDRNKTTYACQDIQCRCMPGEMLCGKDGSVDITEFLEQEVKGPGTYECESGAGCKFREPAMNDLINQIFGDSYISLDCESGECLHYTQVPGFERPAKPSNGLPLVLTSVTAAILLMGAIGGAYYAANRKAANAGYTPLDQEQLDHLMSNHVAATLAFRDVQYSIGDKSILHGVHGIVKPGQVLAIMGASGAGKSTFLDILAKRHKSGSVSGEIMVNGKAVEANEYKRIVGYVDQEDTLMSTLTVEETIMYSALLRLPRNMSDEAKRARVQETMTELGILEIAQSRIGNSDVRGISGGEKRRVSIACELVTSPSILFLDEPTSGLDAYNAYNVVECLVNLARNFNRTVVFTIHQPRSNIYALFDQLLLLARGKMVYSGDAQTAVTHFSSLGFECPVGFNIADYLLDLSVYVDQSSPSRSGTSEAINQGQNQLAIELHAGDERGSASSPGSPRRGLTSVRSIQERKLFSMRSPGTAAPQQQPKPAPLRIGEPESDREEEDVYWEDDVRGLPSSKSNRSKHKLGSGSLSLLAQQQSAENSAHLQTLVQGYSNSDTFRSVQSEIRRTQGQPNGNSNAIDRMSIVSDTSGLQTYNRASWYTQFRILSDRTFKNLYRNPYLLLTHYLISIFVALLCGCLFWNIGTDIGSFQNRMGCFFFICALFGFGCLSSLQVFASERILFMRERANRYYAPFTYFLSKVLFDIVPLRVVPPLLLGAIVYPMVGLVNVGATFFKFLLALVLFNLTSASVCLQIGLLFPDLSIANLLSSLVMLFSMLFGGLLLNKDTIPVSLRWLKHLSFFNYALEALVVNELKDLQLTEKKYGLEIDVPAAVILSLFGFDAQAFWPDMIKLFVMCSLTLAGSFVVLQFIHRKQVS